MKVFNQNKEDLIKSINEQIERNDKICSKLSKSIHKYSQKRMQLLKQQRDEQFQKLNKLKIIKKQHLITLSDLQSDLKFQQQEEESLLLEIKNKQKYETELRKELIFLQEKNQEQRPHLQSYLQQNEKNLKSSIKIQYAKNKLKQLQEKYKKQCQEIQYKYKLLQLMKEALRQKRQQNQKSLQYVLKKGTQRLSAFDCCSIKENSQEIGVKDTEFSQNQIQQTLRHFCD